MAISPNLELRQSASLVLTPQLQQAIKLLQLSSVELLAYVEEELERNPLLERDDDRGDDEAPVSDIADAAGGADEGLDMDFDNLWNGDGVDGSAVGADDFERAGAFEEWGRRGGSFDGGESNLEQMVSGADSLRDHLLNQLHVELDDPVDRLIGLHLIDMLGEAGYVIGDLDVLARLLECEVGRVERTLARLQEFDPPGVFARNLAECLSAQLRDRDRLDSAMQAILANLDLVAKRDIRALQEATGCDAETLTEMVTEIRTLDPKPAVAFDHAVAQPVTPDILMRAAPGGGWIVELNQETQPRVLIDNHYHVRVNRGARNKEERHYIAQCFQSASWLVKSLHQRATTILKVASEIVCQQSAFFNKGVEHLRPLVLRDIAQAIEMHESTVSRVTTNKFIATPRGIYEL
ncbi:MAG: RNA polymerase factor sigma-54, partial [Rhodospirillales bacterium]|nr:RNA polymerase factor sigma-54 [Rhodospirillales bacterium]